MICFLLCSLLIQGISLDELYDEDTRPLCPCGNSVITVNARVVGGHDVGRNSFPYASGLLFRSQSRKHRQPSQPYCGGTLITDRHILTAAHCLKNWTAKELSVDVGDYDLRDHQDGQLINVRRVTKYPEYVEGKYHTDIGILELSRPVRFRPGMRTAILPGSDLELPPGTMVTVYGWGRLQYSGGHPDKLQGVALPVVDNAKCQRKFRSKIEPSMLCAGGRDGKDSCIGDSGSGLVVRSGNEKVLVGVVSFGRRCALPNVPGVYARVSSFMDWILDHTQSANCQPCIYGDNV